MANPELAVCRAGSHWEQRILKNEVMGAVSLSRSVRSALTLATLEDSGWYKANYSMAEPLAWGRGAGCEWLHEPCVDGSGGTQRDFCATAGVQRCTADHRALGVCNRVTHGIGAIPDRFQYFPNASGEGGLLPTADYCPYYSPYPNAHCDEPSHAPVHNFRGQTYGGSSRCVESRLEQSVLIGDAEYVLSAGAPEMGCHVTRCTNGTLELLLNATPGDELWLRCPTPGMPVPAPPGAMAHASAHARPPYTCHTHALFAPPPPKRRTGACTCNACVTSC